MSEERAEFEKWSLAQPLCLGYPECDGALVGMEHSEKCPVKTPGRTSDTTYFDAYAAGKRAGDRELVETLRLLPDLLTNVAQILDVVKGEWGEAWSDWDQEQRDRITTCLALLAKEGE